jgi:hypothetical protein
MARKQSCPIIAQILFRVLNSGCPKLGVGYSIRLKVQHVSAVHPVGDRRPKRGADIW